MAPERFWVGGEWFTPLENKILPLVSEGLTDPQIAARLDLAPRTISNYLGRIFDKTGLRNRTAVAQWYVEARREGSDTSSDNRYRLALFESVDAMYDAIRSGRRTAPTHITIRELSIQEALLRQFRDTFPNDRPALDYRRGRAMAERLSAFTEKANSIEIRGKATLRDLDEIDHLLPILSKGEDYVFDVARTLRASVYYVSGCWMNPSVMLYRKNLREVTTPWAKAFCIRSILGGVGILHDQGQLSKKEALKLHNQDTEKALKIIEELDDPADRALVFEGISYAQGWLGLDPHSASTQAKREYDLAIDNGTDQAIVAARVARTAFLTLLHLPEPNPDLVYVLANDALSICNQYNKARYSAQVIDLLCSHEDGDIREYGASLRPTHRTTATQPP